MSRTIAIIYYTNDTELKENEKIYTFKIIKKIEIFRHIRVSKMLLL